MRKIKNLVLVFLSFILLNCKKDKKDNTATANNKLVIDPPQGRRGGIVTITGENFATNKEDNIVRIGNAKAEIITLNISATGPDVVTIKIPKDATTGKLTIKAGNTFFEGPVFTIIGPHTIAQVLPAEGLIGTEIVIKGTFFSPVAGENKLTINNTALKIISATATEIKCIIPDGITTGKINIDILGFSVEGPIFKVVANPTILHNITSFVPEKGVVGGEIVILGSNFIKGKTNIKFNGVEATAVNFITTEKITVKVPVGATDGKITATIGDFTATSAGSFDVQEDNNPVIVSFTPLSGGPGTIVTIVVKNFSKDNYIVDFPGAFYPWLVAPVKTKETINGETQLTVVVPHAAITGSIRVMVDFTEAVSVNAFVLPDGPIINTFKPAKATPGTEVTIIGIGFSNKVNENIVKIKGVDIPVISATENQLVVKIPPTLSFLVDYISVTAKGNIDKSPQLIFVQPLTVINLFSGQSAKKGDKIFISGTAFADKKEDVKVFFTTTGTTTVSATVLSVQSDKVEIIVPDAAITGKVFVQVYNGTMVSSLDNLNIEQ